MGLLSAQSVFVCFSVSWQLQIWEGRNCPFANVEMLNLDEEYSCYFSLRDGNWVFELQNPFCRNGTHWLRSGLSWQQRKRDKMTWERAWSHFLCGPRPSQVARAICISILWEKASCPAWDSCIHSSSGCRVCRPFICSDLKKSLFSD